MLRLGLAVCFAALAGCDNVVIAGDPYSAEPPPTEPAVTPPVTPPAEKCTPLTAFAQRYGQAWRPDDVGYVTQDGAVHRGVATLDVAAAAKNALVLRVLGTASPVVSLRLYRTGADDVLAQRTEPEFLGGVAHTLWKKGNGYGGAELTQVLLNQWVMDVPTALQQRANLEVTLGMSDRIVPEADRADWRRAAELLVEQVRSGRLTMRNGSGDALTLADTLQVVNGKRFRFAFSNSWGMPYELGTLREGAWGPLWELGMPVPAVCGGCAEASLRGQRYASCNPTVSWADARAACQGRGGELATYRAPLESLFVRALSGDGERWIGLTDAEQEGTFKWVDGRPLEFTRWRELEPNDLDGEDCTVQIDSRGTVALWNDRPCSSQRGYACALP